MQHRIGRRRTSLASIVGLAICVFIISATFLSAQSIWKEAKNPTWNSATGAEQYEHLLWKAIRAKDWLAVESHIASNFVYVDAAGTKDKAQRIAELKAASPPDAEMADVNVTASGIDAIVTYTLAGNRIMSLWQQQKRGWVLVATSVTPINTTPSSR